MQRGGIDVALRELGKLEQVIDELGTLPRKVSIEAAPKITRLLQRQFAQGVDPYGRPWARLKTGRRSHLSETERLRSHTRAAPNLGGRMGIRLIVGSMGDRRRNPIVHQTGTRNMVARKILPDRGMPAAWRATLDQTARVVARRATSRLR